MSTAQQYNTALEQQQKLNQTRFSYDNFEQKI